MFEYVVCFEDIGHNRVTKNGLVGTDSFTEACRALVDHYGNGLNYVSLSETSTVIEDANDMSMQKFMNIIRNETGV